MSNNTPATGRLHLVNHTPYTHISEYVDLALAALIHHGYAHHQQFDQASSTASHDASNTHPSATPQCKGLVDMNVIRDMPPLSLMGHNYGALIAFELAREFEKDMATTRLNFHKLIVSAARPPQVIRTSL